jgi:hypothetical protein
MYPLGVIKRGLASMPSASLAVEPSFALRGAFGVVIRHRSVAVLGTAGAVTRREVYGG